jgi:4a-hydroxytetrahydrobiopterin dehydratase
MPRLEYIRLTDAQIAEELARLEGWSIQDGLLTRAFAFDDYLGGARFALSVAEIADALDHHPEIAIGWRKVKVSVNTHAVQGISPYDFELARRIEALL